MIRLTRRLDTPAPPTHALTLTLEQRVRSRLRVTLDDGSPAGLFLERGHILRDGDCVAGDDGEVAEVRAAAETVSTARCEDPVQLARVCYHLGNRHVLVQIGPDLVRYHHDHVLDAMVRGLGLSVTVEHAPFEPEWGAYHEAHTHGIAHEHHHPA
jgi:urease accessory protein